MSLEKGTLPYDVSGKGESCEFHWKVDLMEQQIQDLVDSIRKEGLDEANRERDRIIAQAKAEADRIVKEARENAAKMIEDATKECELRQQSTKASLVQASRDVALSLKGEINDQLAKILSQQIAASFDKELVAKIVAAAVEAGLKDTTIEISGQDAQSIVASLSASLASKLKGGLSLKVGTGYDGARLVEVVSRWRTTTISFHPFRPSEAIARVSCPSRTSSPSAGHASPGRTMGYSRVSP